MNAKKNKTKFSKLRLRNNVLNSPTEKISSYFPKLSQQNYTELDDDAEEEDKSKSAPVSLEINDSVDEKDFKEIKKPARQLKLFMCDKRKRNEDIELAIALSKSVEELQEPSTSSSGELLKKTLERYGFRSTMRPQNNLKPSTQKRKKPKFIRTVLFLRSEEDRMNIIQGKISEIMNNVEGYNEHVMRIEATETVPVENELKSDKPSSFILRDMYDSNSTLFKKSALDERNDDAYFNSLVDRNDSCKIGSLLRNWHNIPGREKTPPREHSMKKTKSPGGENQSLNEMETNSEQEIKKNFELKNKPEVNFEHKNEIEESFEKKNQYSRDESVNYVINKEESSSENLFRGESPELFSDDDAACERNLNPEKFYKSKNFESPIKHYESFNDAVCFDISSCSDELFPDQNESGGAKNCIDLTQTSEESNDVNIKKMITEKIETETGNNLKLICTENNENLLEEMVIDFEETENNSEEMKIYSIKSDVGLIKNGTSSVKIDFEETKKNETASDDMKIYSVETGTDREKNKINFDGLKKNFTRSKSFSNTKQNINSTVQNFQRSKSLTDDVKNLSDSKSVLDEIDEIIDDDNFEKSSVLQKTSDDTLQNCAKLIHNHSELFLSNATENFSNSKKNSKISNNTKSSSTKIDNESQKSILCESFSDNEVNNSKEINNLKMIKTNQLTNIDLTLSSEEEKINSSFGDDRENDKNSNSSVKKNSSHLTNAPASLENSPKDSPTSPKGYSSSQKASPASPKKFPSPKSPNVFVLSDTESENDSNPNLSSCSTRNKTEQKSLTYKFNESCIKKIEGPDENEKKRKFSSHSIEDQIKSYKFNESCIKKNPSLSGSENEKNQSLSQSENLSLSDNFSSVSLSSDEELNYSSNMSFKRRKKILNRSEKIKDFDENSIDIDENIEDIQNYMDIDLNIDDIENYRGDYKSFRDVDKNEDDSKNLMNDENNENNRIDLNLDNIESDSEENENDPWAMDHFEYPHDVVDEIDQLHEDENIYINTVQNPPGGSSPKNQSKTDTPNKIESVPSTSNNTPDNFIVKTVNVTPMPSYIDMDTPDRHKELEKFGLKPMKKPKSVKILEYIYNATHPIAPKRQSANEDVPENSKRRKLDKKQKFVTISNSQVRRRQSQRPQNYVSSDIKILGDEIANCESVEEMIFEKKYSAKIKTCRVPLHIVWHNFVSSQPELLESILLYEPLQIEEIHLKIKKLGYNFDIQDLISFLDKKCITIRINQNNRLRKKQCDSSS